MNKKANALYFSTQGFYWLMMAPIINFIASYLLPLGFTNGELGIILAVGNIIALILQPLMSDFADRSKRISLPTLTIFTALVLLAIILIAYSAPKRGLFLMVTYALMVGMHTAIIPLVNSINFYLERKGYRMNYGICRSGGSIIFATSCIFIGWLVVDYGTKTLAYASILACVILVLVLVWIRRLCQKGPLTQSDALEIQSETLPDEWEEEINLVDFIRRNKLFFIFNLSLFMIFFAHQTINNFLLQVLIPLGGDSQDMGNCFSFMSYAETLMLFFLARLHGKFGVVNMIRFASVFFVIRMIAMFLAGSPTGIFCSMVFQAPGFAIMYSSVVIYINQLMSRAEAVKGQALFTMMMTLSSVVCSFVGGFVLDYLGVSALLIIAIVVSALGVLLLWVVIPKIPLPKRQGYRI